MNINVNIQRSHPNAIIPTFGTEYAAGCDLYNNDREVVIHPNEKAFINTHIKFEIPPGYAGFVFARSSLGCKNGVVPSNCVGVIDSDYRGDIIVCLHNHGNDTFISNVGDRIAQMVILPTPKVTLNVVDDLTCTDRGTGGFGSTGK